MKSLSKLFRYGPGPSSSHTIVPFNAGLLFKKIIEKYNEPSVKVTFYGSLALTGKGHGSDKAVSNALEPIRTSFIFDTVSHFSHPLLMKFEGYSFNKKVEERNYISLGGGELICIEDESVNEKDIYPFKFFSSVVSYMKENNLSSFKDFCLKFEEETIDDYLMTCVKHMFESIEKGLSLEGRIPTGHNPKMILNRCAKSIYEKAIKIENEEDRRTLLITSFAYAVAESNACGEKVVTAPTCGSSGVVPSILYYMYKEKGIPLETIRDSLYAAGIAGNIVKQNASIAGSIGGCQAEIGTASSMAAASLCYMNKLSIHQIEYASECALEHFLGLSCDPVDGYVAIPCIERNGIGAIRAYTSFTYAKYIEPVRKNMVSFDNVVLAMKMTGDSLSSAYKETSLGGLAKILK